MCLESKVSEIGGAIFGVTGSVADERDGAAMIGPAAPIRSRPGGA